jgi:hypothetical protein
MVFFSFRYLSQKTAAASEKSQCVCWYVESGKSAVTVRRNYHRVYRKIPPSANSIKNWCEKFLKTGSVQYHLMLTDDLNVYYSEHCQSSRIIHISFWVDTGWRFPVNSMIITLNGYRWFPWFSIPVHMLGSFRCCSHFLWEISERKKIEINFFRCSFITNKHICSNYPWFWVITFYKV